MSPLPKVFGLGAKRRAMPSLMNDAGVAPPGVMPIQQPTAVERRKVFQCFAISPHVCHTTQKLMRAHWPLKARRSSIVSKILPMPNRPITAIRKSKPLGISGKP